jgi:hypothetical protein
MVRWHFAYFQVQRRFLPSCPYLHTLTFYDCELLAVLGDYENLKCLKIIKCKNLVEVGKMNSLTSLYLRSDPLQKNTFINHFPLEQIEELCCSGCRNQTLTVALLRVSTLRSLAFKINPELDKDAVASFPFNLLLRKLVLHGFKSVILDGLTHLEVLDADKAVAFLGKERIFPRLKSLAAAGKILNREDFRCFPKLKSLSIVDTYEGYLDEVTTVNPQLPSLTRIPEFSYTVKDIHRCLSLCSLVFPDPIVLNPQAKSVEINFPTNTFARVIDVSTFHQLKLGNYFSSDISIFANIEKLYLFDCPMVCHIRCLRRVGYLWIRNCAGIQDFSSLGSQDFLAIENSSNLMDEQMNHWLFTSNQLPQYSESGWRIIAMFGSLAVRVYAKSNFLEGIF